MKRIKYLALLLLSTSLSINTWAMESFLVKHIRIEGLQGISKGTVLTYLPISTGDYFDDSKSGDILKALYGTGFFSNVSLARQDDTLIIKVHEQPIIGNVQVSGNKDIKTEDMDKVLKELGLISGNVFSQEMVEKVKNVLQSYYNNKGFYGAQITVTTNYRTRNRVNVNIHINEKKYAQIYEIKIIGNKAFSSFRLKRLFEINTPRPWSFITHDDQYSKLKLDASLEKIRSFYMDQGYLRFRIIDSDVKLSDDKRKVYLTVSLFEGPRYTFKGYDFSGDASLLTNTKGLVAMRPGDVFSRTLIEQSVENIHRALGDKGYAFAQVDAIPTIDESTRKIWINFRIANGPQVYVRRITFSGNTVTGDYVLRRRTKQMEGALISTSKVQESIRQYNLLGYFKDVQVKMKPVPGTNNQVDVEYQVVETPAGKALLNVGYGTIGWEVGGGIDQTNFLGTGRSLGINAEVSRYVNSIMLNYYDPFYSINNVGRGVQVFYTKTKPGSINLANYNFDTYGSRLFYGIPLTENDAGQLGVEYDHYNLNVGAYPSVQIQSFLNQYGMNFNNIVLSAGLNHVGQDRGFFPTQGYNQGLMGQLSIPSFNDSLSYYKIGYGGDWLIPVDRKRNFIFDIKGGVAYGSNFSNNHCVAGANPCNPNINGLPFFLNYYAGGLSQGLVRGYETNTLGPRDSNGLPLGGNFLANGTLGLIFPNFISPDTLRTALFLDAGNVFQTNKNLIALSGGPMRFSGGIAVTWRSPIGPLSFSLAAPINPQVLGVINGMTIRDEKQIFQFNMGTSF